MTPGTAIPSHTTAAPAAGIRGPAGSGRSPARATRPGRCAVIACAMVIAFAALSVAAPAMAATSGTGAGIGAGPVCRGTPLVPGRAYQLDSDGLTPGVKVTNTGTGSEDLTLSVTSQPGHLPGLPVPATWVSFGYPKMLLIIPEHDVSLAAGANAYIPVTITVPPGARRGTYVAGLAVSAATGSGGVQLGAAAETLMVFTIGIAKPPWPARQLAATGNCWAPPGTYVPWQQWAGTPYPAAPPGWHWQDPAGGSSQGAWVYTPPPGWYYSWANPDDPHQVYRGGHPARPCASPAGYPDPAGGSFIGGQNPDTSTAAGCAAWLAHSKAGTLTAEPSLPGAAPGPQPAPPVQAAAGSPPRGTAPVLRDASLGAVLALLAVVAWAWHRRHIRRQRRRFGAARRLPGRGR